MWNLFKTKRFIYLLSLAIISFVPVYYEAGQFFVASETITNLVGMLYSILTASVLAVITLCSNTSYSLRQKEDWKKIWNKSKTQISILYGLIVVFWIYLTTLCLLVAVIIVSDQKLEPLYWLVDLFTFLVTFGIGLGLSVPFEIFEFQKRKLSQHIESIKPK